MDSHRPEPSDFWRDGNWERQVDRDMYRGMALGAALTLAAMSFFFVVFSLVG